MLIKELISYLLVLLKKVLSSLNKKIHILIKKNKSRRVRLNKDQEIKLLIKNYNDQFEKLLKESIQRQLLKFQEYLLQRIETLQQKKKIVFNKEILIEIKKKTKLLVDTVELEKLITVHDAIEIEDDDIEKKLILILEIDQIEKTKST